MIKNSSTENTPLLAQTKEDEKEFVLPQFYNSPVFERELSVPGQLEERRSHRRSFGVSAEFLEKGIPRPVRLNTRTLSDEPLSSFGVSEMYLKQGIRIDTSGTNVLEGSEKVRVFGIVASCFTIILSIAHYSFPDPFKALYSIYNAFILCLAVFLLSIDIIHYLYASRCRQCLLQTEFYRLFSQSWVKGVILIFIGVLCMLRSKLTNLDILWLAVGIFVCVVALLQFYDAYQMSRVRREICATPLEQHICFDEDLEAPKNS